MMLSGGKFHISFFQVLHAFQWETRNKGISNLPPLSILTSCGTNSLLAFSWQKTKYCSSKCKQKVFFIDFLSCVYLFTFRWSNSLLPQKSKQRIQSQKTIAPTGSANVACSILSHCRQLFVGLMGFSPYPRCVAVYTFNFQSISEPHNEANDLKSKINKPSLKPSMESIELSCHLSSHKQALIHFNVIRPLLQGGLFMICTFSFISFRPGN